MHVGYAADLNDAKTLQAAAYKKYAMPSTPKDYITDPNDDWLMKPTTPTPTMPSTAPTAPTTPIKSNSTNKQTKPSDTNKVQTTPGIPTGWTSVVTPTEPD